MIDHPFQDGTTRQRIVAVFQAYPAVEISTRDLAELIDKPYQHTYQALYKLWNYRLVTRCGYRDKKWRWFRPEGVSS